MKYPKLNKWTKARIRNHLVDRQRADLERKAKEAESLLIRIATRMIDAEWRDKQDDMEVLARYKRAGRITGANLRLYDPDSKLWNITFGVKHDFGGLMMPGTPYGDSGLYWDGYVRDDDPDHNALMAVHTMRMTYRDNHKAEMDSLNAAMRATSSWRKLAEDWPWIDDLLGSVPAA